MRPSPALDGQPAARRWLSLEFHNMLIFTDMLRVFMRRTRTNDNGSEAILEKILAEKQNFDR
jgi:hypothetical protein